MARLTQKQENFVQAYLRHGNAYKAYLEAYDVKPNTRRATVDQSASRLLNSPKIASRLSTLNTELAEQVVEIEAISRVAKSAEVDYSVDKLTEMLQQVYDRAIDSGSASALSAAASATMSIGRLKGVVVDKSDNKVTHDVADPFKELLQDLNQPVFPGARSDPAHAAGSDAEPEEFVPTVSGHGTA